MEPDSYVLQFNRTQLLFVPAFGPGHCPDTTPGTVVQVCIRGDIEDGDISDVFSVKQASITTTIETLLVGHVNALHELPEYVTVKGVVPGYTLIGMRKAWKYGRGKKFCLGDTMLQPAQDKWIFHLEKVN